MFQTLKFCISLVDECIKEPWPECCQGKCIFGFVREAQQVCHNQSVSSWQFPWTVIF